MEEIKRLRSQALDMRNQAAKLIKDAENIEQKANEAEKALKEAGNI